MSSNNLLARFFKETSKKVKNRSILRAQRSVYSPSFDYFQEEEKKATEKK